MTNPDLNVMDRISENLGKTSAPSSPQTTKMHVKNQPIRNWMQKLETLWMKSPRVFDVASPEKVRKATSQQLGEDVVATDRLIEVLAKINQVPQRDRIKKDSTAIKQVRALNENRSIEHPEYATLYKTLAEKDDYPWNEIKLIHCPHLMEPLVNLYNVGISKGLENETKTIMAFALNIANVAAKRCEPINATCPKSKGIVDDAKLLLGKLIHLTNINPKNVINILRNKDRTECLELIDLSFKSEIEVICLRLDNLYDQHSSVPLQSPELALNNRLPVEIANLLLTDIGTINIGIIPLLVDVFLKHKEPYFNHEINIAYAMKILQNSPKLRIIFEKIHKPKNPSQSSNDIIRVLLKIPPENPISDLDAKRSALAALLSHLRQSEDGTCFATYLAIEFLSSQLNVCLEDFADLLENDKLTRKVKGVKMDFPFLLKMWTEDLKNEFEVSSDGQVKDGGYLWDAPGLQSAAEIMDIKDLREAILVYLKKSYSLNSNKKFVSTPRDVIKSLSNNSTQFSKGCFAFEAQTQNPLLKSWENAIAGMSEALESGMIKTNILQSTIPALVSAFPKDTATKYQDVLRKEFQREILKNITLQYDPDCSKTSTQPEEKSLDGAFVLYDKSEGDRFNKWKRIDNQQLFVNFLVENLKRIEKRVLESFENSADKSICLKTLNNLIQAVATNDMMEMILKRYHPTNKELSSNEGENEHLNFTPWITRTGNQSKMVLQIYIEKEGLETEKFLPMSAEKLLNKIIEMGKSNPQLEKKTYLDNPNKMVPIIATDIHSFSLMLGHPSIVKAWNGDTPTEDWIKQCVVEPGKEIANEVVPSTIRRTLIEWAQDKVAQTTDKEKVRKLIQKIPSGLSIRNYRNQILNVLASNEINSEKKMDRWSLEIDTILIENLPSNLKKKLADSAVHFADTNWCKGLNDIHFCLVVNPGSGELEIWEAYDDGTHFRSLDQKIWLLHHVWEFVKNSSI